MSRENKENGMMVTFVMDEDEVEVRIAQATDMEDAYYDHANVKWYERFGVELPIFRTVTLKSNGETLTRDRRVGSLFPPHIIHIFENPIENPPPPPVVISSGDDTDSEQEYADGRSSNDWTSMDSDYYVPISEEERSSSSSSSSENSQPGNSPPPRNRSSSSSPDASMPFQKTDEPSRQNVWKGYINPNHLGGSSSRGGSSGVTTGRRRRGIDWTAENLQPIQKDFYQENAAVSLRDQHKIDQWVSANQVTLEGRGIPRPVFEFNEAPLPGQIHELLYGKFQKPTVIQSISWPIAMSGRDIISIAKTGSGKTLAFMLPALVHITKQPHRQRGEGPSVLVLLPTRELAQQVQEVSIDFCHSLGLKMTCLFGGASKGPQARDLERGVDIAVATPGRLLDFLDNGTTNMKRCSYLVLDEADRMLDMGFEPQIRKIIGQIRPDRQILMFSATWPKEVRSLASDFQNDAAFLNVGSLELAANHNITQVVDVLEEHAKQAKLMELLNHIMNQKECKTIIFVETKRKADDLTRAMRRDGWPTLCIHGDKNQGERDWVLQEFKAGKMPILLATDVAARGLEDVDDIKFVINYDYPNNSEDYVHRIGRTGRRDKKGTAYTFFTHTNASKAKDLLKVLDEAKQNVPQALRDMGNRSYGGSSSRGRYGGGGGGKRGYGGNDNFAPKRPRYDIGGYGGGGGGRW